MTLLKILRDMASGVTVHGFRSAFRDWVAEEPNVPGEIAEACLAHTNSNKVKAAYRRTDFLEAALADARLGRLLHWPAPFLRLIRFCPRHRTVYSGMRCGTRDHVDRIDRKSEYVDDSAIDRHMSFDVSPRHGSREPHWPGRLEPAGT